MFCPFIWTEALSKINLQSCLEEIWCHLTLGLATYEILSELSSFCEKPPNLAPQARYNKHNGSDVQLIITQDWPTSTQSYSQFYTANKTVLIPLGIKWLVCGSRAWFRTVPSGVVVFVACVRWLILLDSLVEANLTLRTPNKSRPAFDMQYNLARIRVWWGFALQTGGAPRWLDWKHVCS